VDREVDGLQREQLPAPGGDGGVQHRIVVVVVVEIIGEVVEDVVEAAELRVGDEEDVVEARSAEVVERDRARHRGLHQGTSIGGERAATHHRGLGADLGDLADLDVGDR